MDNLLQQVIDDAIRLCERDEEYEICQMLFNQLTALKDVPVKPLR